MTRNEFRDMVSRKRCSECGQRRLLVGPFYDMTRVRCLSCGKVVRLVIKRKVSK